jgi:hypothetical protein
MRYKSKVLAQHPDAKPVVLRRYPDMEPRYVAIYAGKRRLDCDQDDPGDNRSWAGEQRLHNAAWRSAYYYLVRQRRAAAGDALVLSVARMLG